MMFYVALACINIACFVPLYLLNCRAQPNPLAFIVENGLFSRSTLRLLYARKRYTDPFRINFDFTFLVLLAITLPAVPHWLVSAISLVLALGFIEILYATIMQSVFGRAPSFASDLVLLKTGWTVAHRNRLLIVIGVLLSAACIIWLAAISSKAVFALAPQPGPLPAVLAVLLLLPCLYGWRRFSYAEFIWRVTYSPTLHVYRNIVFGQRVKHLVNRGAAYFDSLNQFKAVALETRPSIVVICIESYGSVVYKDDVLHRELAGPLAGMADELRQAGYLVASTFSAAPIFAGGSWLSYSSLTYGVLFDDAYVHDCLFGADSDFGGYESLFHILERNGYKNNLLCPLGGVGSRYVNWDSLDRCFRPQRKFDYDSLGYSGDAHSFFVPNDLVAAPDQYSLNFAYESIRAAGEDPFSLFFCTLNSHYPWTAALEVVDDWRSLNQKSPLYSGTRAKGDSKLAYAQAIEYQLRNIVDFLSRNAADNMILIAFGDHQPPFITGEGMGKSTPIHVFSRDSDFQRVFLEHGFSAALDIANASTVGIKHQGFLSLLIKAMNANYGAQPALAIEYRPDGTVFTDDR